MTEPEEAVRAVFADAGCIGWLHARRLGPLPAEVSTAAAQRVVTASVYKLLVLLAFCRAVDEHRIDPLEPIRVVPTQCTPGPSGLSLFRDPVTVSGRDLAASMMTISDNAAGDLVLAMVGLDAVNALAREIGLIDTVVIGGTAAVHTTLVRDTDSHSTAEAFAALANDELGRNIAAYDPAYTSATTPIEMTALLAAVWSGRVVSVEQTEFVREVMRQQVFRHRVAGGFPFTGVRVAGKTGTIGVIRNEIAVVEFDGEYPVAVAIFTRAARSTPNLPMVDAAIGTAARIAVTHLRLPIDHH